MKKVLFIMISLLAISFYSCSDDNAVANSDGTELTGNTMRQVQENLKCMRLQGSLHDYNVQMFGSDQSPKTRGWLKNLFKKVVNIIVTVAADAVGGSVGGIAGGVAASAAVGALVYTGSVEAGITPICKSPGLGGGPLPIFNEDSVSFRYLVPDDGIVSFAGLDSLGFYHNKVISRIFTQKVKVSDFICKSDDEKAEIVVSEIVKEPYIMEYY